MQSQQVWLYKAFYNSASLTRDQLSHTSSYWVDSFYKSLQFSIIYNSRVECKIHFGVEEAHWSLDIPGHLGFFVDKARDTTWSSFIHLRSQFLIWTHLIILYNVYLKCKCQLCKEKGQIPWDNIGHFDWIARISQIPETIICSIFGVSGRLFLQLYYFNLLFIWYSEVMSRKSKDHFVTKGEQPSKFNRFCENGKIHNFVLVYSIGAVLFAKYSQKFK